MPCAAAALPAYDFLPANLAERVAGRAPHTPTGRYALWFADRRWHSYDDAKKQVSIKIA